jgi:hypothetical protein
MVSRTLHDTLDEPGGTRLHAASGYLKEGRGTLLRQYAAAVVVATAVVVAAMTMLADRLYSAYVRFFGP